MMSHLLSSNFMSQRLFCTFVVMMFLFAKFFADPISAKDGCGKHDRVVDVGVVLDANSKSGKQMIAAIEVACRNQKSEYKLEINPRYMNSDGDPRQAISLAEELIGREEVQVLVWLDTWLDETILSETSRRSRIPIVSFAIGDRYSRSLGGKYSNELKEFRQKFAKRFHQVNGTREVKNLGPSINALRAYDCITAIVRSFDSTNCKIFTRKISEMEFMGLSGPIDLEKATTLRLWLPTVTKKWSKEAARRREYQIVEDEATMKLSIGVPRRTPFDLFVKEVVNEMTGEKDYVGFCIDVFLAARHGLDYYFVPHDGTYDELVEKVHNQTYDSAVGDITILANRSKNVTFTQPFMESSLSMIVLARPDSGKRFLFTKPFTLVMWAVSGGVLLYTVFIVWALEHRHNKEFSGPPTRQLSTALWFTFSSLFFAHREHVHHTLTRIVLVMWFFVALILMQSYTASLTSMLTLQSIKPSKTTIEWLRTQKAVVGCESETFMCDYLVNVQNFREDNIRRINDPSSYNDHFQNRSISALFLESPYEKAFSTHYRSGYVNTQLSYRFGGFGFVFPKNSPLAENFSEAILELSEKGNLSRLQNHWFAPGCFEDENNNSSSIIDRTSLGLSSFWVLYALTIGTSTCCLILSCFCSRKRDDYLRNESGGNIGSPTMEMNRYFSQRTETRN